MIPDINDPYEKERLQNLRSYEILDSATDEDFDHLTELASAICATPIALISLIDANRQWFKSKVGMDGVETPRDISFCSHALGNNDVFQVPDATKDMRFMNNPFVKGEPFIRFYAGAPLTSPEGYDLGTLCVVDERPRVLSKEQSHALKILAHQVMELIKLRKLNKDLNLARNMLMDQEKLAVSRARSESAGELARDVWQEIHHPLAMLLTRSDRLKRKLKKVLPAGDPSLKELEVIYETLGRLSQVLKTLGLYTKSSGEHLDSTDLNELIETTLTLFSNRFQHEKILISFQKSPPSRILCHRDRVNEAIQELFENALENLKESDVKILKIKSELHEKNFSLTISDTGQGMKTGTHLNKSLSLMKECHGDIRVVSSKNPTIIELTMTRKPF
jgi:GAF domain